MAGQKVPKTSLFEVGAVHDAVMLRCANTAFIVPHVCSVIIGGSRNVTFVTASPSIADSVTKYGGYFSVDMYSATW